MADTFLTHRNSVTASPISAVRGWHGPLSAKEPGYLPERAKTLRRGRDEQTTEVTDTNHHGPHDIYPHTAHQNTT